MCQSHDPLTGEHIRKIMTQSERGRGATPTHILHECRGLIEHLCIYATRQAAMNALGLIRSGVPIYIPTSTSSELYKPARKNMLKRYPARFTFTYPKAFQLRWNKPFRRQGPRRRCTARWTCGSGWSKRKRRWADDREAHRRPRLRMSAAPLQQFRNPAPRSCGPVLVRLCEMTPDARNRQRLLWEAPAD